MDLRALFFMFTMLWRMSSSLRCYKCESEFQTYTEKLCQHFNYSESFVVECEHSTMCYKKEIVSSLGVILFERGCALQTLEGDQERTRHGWRRSNKTYEPYIEGCEGSPANSERLTVATYCYCRGDLCNGTTVIYNSPLLLLVIGLMFLVRQ